MKTLLFLLWPLLIFLACTQPVQMELDERTGGAVVYGLLEPDSVAQIIFTQVKSPYGWIEDTLDLDFIEDLEPVLSWEGGEEVLTGSWGWELSQPSWGRTDSTWLFRYRGGTPLQAGKTYSLRCTYRDELITAETSIPPKPEILEVNFFDVVQTFSNNFSFESTDFNARIRDVAGEDNGYRVGYTSWEWKYETDLDPATGETIVVDSQWVPFHSIFFLMYDQGAEGGLLDLRHYNFRYNQDAQAGDTIRQEVPVVVQVFDETFRTYTKSVFGQLSQSYGSGFFNQPPSANLNGQLNWGTALQEPVLLQGNVENGVGVMGSFHTSDTFWVSFEKVVE
ncbi:MAG: DUF4249 family protein [Bacteroidota bacterium]